MLKPYASFPEKSRGRRFPEKESERRTCFQRDRDRVIHSYSFRRLQNKTQVFVSGTGDFFRTRLTHSLEAAQVARSIAQSLGLNVDLAEAIALAHDLGHPPFGHSGEEALNELMEGRGGFSHNSQTLKVITRLERQYADFPGLNLTWETLEGLAKHNGPMPEGGMSVYEDIMDGYDLELGSHAGLEAQVASISDDIAYNSHDTMDGLKAEMLDESEVMRLPALKKCYEEVNRQCGGADQMVKNHEALRRFFGKMVKDVISNSERMIAQAGVGDAGEARACEARLVGFSSELKDDIKTIQKFLFKSLYRNVLVDKDRQRFKKIVRDLFNHCLENPSRLQADGRSANGGKEASDDSHRMVCDYIAGMSDRYAIDLYEITFGVRWVDL